MQKILNFYVQIPNLPDAELALCRFFIRGGFQVIDATRYDPLTKLDDLEQIEKELKKRSKER